MRFIIVSEETIYSGIIEAMFKDIIDLHKAEILTEYLKEDNRFRKKVFNILYKNKVNHYLNYHFEPILKPKYNLIETLNRNQNEKTCVIFMNSSLQKFYDENNLRRIKSMYKNVHFILLFIDSSFQPQAKKAIELSHKNIFDLVYTYNEDDSKKYGFIYYQTPYSCVVDSIEKPINGVYFCGSEKGRTDYLIRIANKLKNEEIEYKFDVYGDKHKVNRYFQVKKYGYKKYEQVVKDTISYSCILDLIQESNGIKPGLSLRVFEAVAYGRTLITNNDNILNFKYYNPKYMHLIHNADDIKPEWICKKVDYCYKDELSPIHFIDDIKMRLYFK